MKKKSDYIIVMFFLIFIYGIAFANIFTKDRSYSEAEKRMLAQKPEFRVADIVSGKYMEDFETYITDQFVARDLFVDVKSVSEKALGKRINNGVYYGKDGYLIEQFASVDEELLKKNVVAVQKFAENTSANVSLAIIPGSVEINREKLSGALPDIDQKELIDKIYDDMSGSNITCVDMYSSLWEHREENLYYRTDHHWTSLGAYYGYRAYAEAVGLVPTELEAYKEQVRSEEFYGTLYSKAGAFWIAPDSISTYVDEEGIVVEHIEGETTKTGTLYDMSKLSGSDKYSMFLGGNQPLAIIKNSQNNQSKLLVIRDSYSDSLAPFLTGHYSEIYMWDFRYNKESVSTFIEENDIEQVLICYSMDNFSEDTNISFVLGRE